ncbi:MAG TPA: SHOCT domain-containing protein [Pseudogracilibacillus sp.]|nr:SHOCT domain-containing protein [Pseudogracilibacillus sp.]
MQIIKERLAKGEIDESEYERLKSIIKQDGK